MNVKLTLFHFKELQRLGFTLDMIFLLKLAEDDADLGTICLENAKLEVILQGILRKGLITPQYKITLMGRNLINFLKEDAPEEKLVKLKANAEDFERWWRAYPGTDTFSHNGVKFQGTRAFRTKKDECQVKFNSILSEGDYTVDDMVEAIEFDVLQKKENSFKTKTNRLTFLQNTLTYLNQRTFEPFIELIKEGHKIELSKPISKGTDI
jgi:hypothetical protein